MTTLNKSWKFGNTWVAAWGTFRAYGATKAEAEFKVAQQAIDLLTNHIT